MDISGLPPYRNCTFADISPSVHWAQLHSTRKHREYPVRRIYDFELLYLLEGRITAYLGDQAYGLSAGELLFIGAGIPHHLKVESAEDALFLGIHFDYFDELDILVDQDIIVKEETYRPELVCLEPLLPGFKPFSQSPVQLPPSETVVQMEALIEEFQLREPGYETICRGLMMQILVRLYRAGAASERSIHPAVKERMVWLAKWLEAHYGEDCSSKRLTALTNLNEDYLAKQFKAAFGLPPGKYVQMIRHREAKRLLRQTELSIEAVGREVGYEDIHYFSRIFRLREGIPPSEYRGLSRIY